MGQILIVEEASISCVTIKVSSVSGSEDKRHPGGKRTIGNVKPIPANRYKVSWEEDISRRNK